MDFRSISRGVKICAIAAAVCLSPVLASAATISGIYGTGVSDTGTPLSDNAAETHYTLASYPGGTSRLIVERPGGFPYFGANQWIGDTPGSAWIRPANANTSDPAGTYTYQLSFDLTGYVLSSVNIAGRWATDNSGSNILVNGTPSNPAQTATGYNTWSNFTIDPSYLKDGLNVIAFVVLNLADGNYPTGLRVEFTSATASPVPLPGPLLLLASGLGALGLVARRRKRRSRVAGAV